MKRTAFFLLCLISLMLLFFCKDSLGAEETSGKEASVPADLNLDQYDLTDIQNFLDQSKGDQGMNLSFKTLMKDLMDGKLNEVMGQVGKALKDLLVGEVRNSGHMMGQIMVLGIIGAVFSNFSSVFTGSQISETGFFVTYLLLFTYLAASFFTSVTITGNVVGQILDFTKVLMPAYFLAAAFAGSSASAAASYEFTLFVIVVAQWLLGQVLLALIR
ncbi:MAG TPA: sporulation protein, partial [Clostridium sp.]|nr:sporulation protein [Clostridium sp.]